MKKSSKLLSGLLAALMTTSCFTGFAVFSANADTDNDLGEQKIYFEFPSDGTWGDPANVKVNNKNKLASVYCYAYSVYGNKTDFYDTGWETKATQCTWEHDNIYSYDLNSSMTVITNEVGPDGKKIKKTLYRHLEEGADYGVIFSTGANGGFQTADINMSYDCIGDTIRLTSPTKTRENSSNSQKSDYFGEWIKNTDIKVKANITSTGKFADGQFPAHQPKAQMLSNSLKQYLTNPTNVGFFQLENNLKLCASLGVEPIDVYNQYISDNADSIANGVIETDPDVPVAFIRYMGKDSAGNDKELKMAAPEEVAKVLGVEPTVPTSEETEPPTSEETEPPTSEETEPPTSEETEPPTSEETEPPTSEETEPPTTEETEPPTTEETEPIPAEDIVLVVGSANIVPSGWSVNPDESDSIMVKQDDGTYKYTFTGVEPDPNGGLFQIKVVELPGGDPDQAIWHGQDGTDLNVDFGVSGLTDVTVTYVPETGEIKVEGDGVIPPVYDIKDIYAVGNGQGSYLNGQNWIQDAESNIMNKVAEGLYEITYEDVGSYDNYQLKFAANGDWTINWGEAKGAEGKVNETTPATYNGENIIFAVEDDGATVKLQLDLRNFDAFTKKGATYTITVTYPEPGPQPGEYKMGDANKDGEITIEDATIIQSIGIDLETADEVQAVICDVNGDGRISILDVTCVQKYIAEYTEGTGKAGEIVNVDGNA